MAADPVQKYLRPGGRRLAPLASSSLGVRGRAWGLREGSISEQKSLYSHILSQTMATTLLAKSGRRKPRAAAPRALGGFSVCKKLALGPGGASSIPFSGLYMAQVVELLTSPNFLSFLQEGAAKSHPRERIAYSASLATSGEAQGLLSMKPAISSRPCPRVAAKVLPG